jgi:hypothetical protein
MAAFHAIDNRCRITCLPGKRLSGWIGGWIRLAPALCFFSKKRLQG